MITEITEISKFSAIFVSLVGTNFGIDLPPHQKILWCGGLFDPVGLGPLNGRYPQ